MLFGGWRLGVVAFANRLLLDWDEGVRLGILKLPFLCIEVRSKD